MATLKIGGKRTALDLVINLRNIANVSYVALRRKVTLKGFVKSVLSYRQSFEEDYFVCLFYMCVIGITYDVMFLSFLANSSETTYVRYV